MGGVRPSFVGNVCMYVCCCLPIVVTPPHTTPSLYHPTCYSQVECHSSRPVFRICCTTLCRRFARALQGESQVSPNKWSLPGNDPAHTQLALHTHPCTPLVGLYVWWAGGQLARLCALCAFAGLHMLRVCVVACSGFGVCDVFFPRCHFGNTSRASFRRAS
jgi:hypothetical protein